MKRLKALFDRQRPRFTAGGRFEKLHPLFQAVEDFFFFPSSPTRADSHIRDSLDLKRFMSFVIFALLPPVLFGIYNTGLQAQLSAGLDASFWPAVVKGMGIVMPLVIVSYAVGLSWEILFAAVRRHPISEGFLVTGLLFPMTLPPTIPLWQAAVGISFGVVIGKEIFGGTGRNLLNPALTGRAFLFFAYPANMSGDAVWTVMQGAGQTAVDGFTAATPLTVAGGAGSGEGIAAALQTAGYSFGRLSVGTYPGSIGATSALLCLLGALILTGVGIASYRIIAGGILGALATGFLLNLFAGQSANAWLGLNPFYHLVMGGFAFGMAYMATDPVSAPGMDAGRWIYGFLIGVLTVLIRVFNPAYPEGIMLAILFMNLFSPLIDVITIRLRLKKRVPNV